jgi:TonB family protein
MTLSLARVILAVAAISWVASGTGAAGQEPAAEDTLARAKDLYVRAAYDEALVLLDRLHQNAPADEANEIAGYQVFCLLALGRTDEAHRAIEAIVEADPLYRPSENAASPRTRAVFDEVRRGLLPRIAKQSYDKAKAAFDRNEHQVALAEFDRAIVLMNEPGLSDLPAMADFRQLAIGFRDLSRAAAASAAAAPAKNPDPVSPAPPTYTAQDTSVVPPVSVSRDTPPWRPRNSVEARREYRGIIEVVVDEKGDVTTAALARSIHSEYDQAVLKTALTWKFRPATKDGVPVRYRAAIEITLRPSGT